MRAASLGGKCQKKQTRQLLDTKRFLQLQLFEDPVTLLRFYTAIFRDVRCRLLSASAEAVTVKITTRQDV